MIHDKDKARFYIDLDGGSYVLESPLKKHLTCLMPFKSGMCHCVVLCHAGEEAVLLYSLERGQVMDMYHTEVPESQRGKGLGGVLAQVSGQEGRGEGASDCIHGQHCFHVVCIGVCFEAQVGGTCHMYVHTALHHQKPSLPVTAHKITHTLI